MNWLSHALLSKRSVAYQLGNILADPLKGVPWDGASQEIIDGMQMHKAIDKFTDSHTIIAASKSRLQKRGHLKGIVIDLLYDHFLSVSWSQYVEPRIENFLEEFNVQAQAYAPMLPDKPRELITHVASKNRLGVYGDFSGFIAALERFDLRLSSRIKAKESTVDYITAVEREYVNLHADFEAFFPQLIEHFKNHDLGDKQDHFFL